jgi:hypothetical protein
MPHLPSRRTTALVAVLVLATSGRAQEPDPLPLPPPAVPAQPQKKIEPSDAPVVVVERGPVHEGFAQPGAGVRGKGITAPKAPPAPVDEATPAAKPEGANVHWLPGYWQWDGDRNDFIWVCGCYRNSPPDRTWEPGQWKSVRGVWTYFPGYWRPTDGKNLVSNQPEPPASKDEPPTAPKDNPNAMWVPGYWQHKNGQFEWQPGYWPASFDNLYWEQGQYVASESGFVFVPGYWDYPLEERGLLNAPVFFSQAQREKRGWAYRPEYAVSFGSNAGWGRGGAFDALYIGPNYNSYYFGHFSGWSVGGSLTTGVAQWDAVADYVEPLLGLYGFGAYQPWNTVSRGYSNPLWQLYVRLNRNDSDWSKNVRSLYETRTGIGFTPGSLGSAGCAPGAGALAGAAIASATVVRPNRVVNALAFVQPATEVVARQSTRLVSTDGGLTQQLVTKNTIAYQHVSRHGVVTTGVVQYRAVSPPLYPGGYRR